MSAGLDRNDNNESAGAGAESEQQKESSDSAANGEATDSERNNDDLGKTETGGSESNANDENDDFYWFHGMLVVLLGLSDCGKYTPSQTVSSGDFRIRFLSGHVNKNVFCNISNYEVGSRGGCDFSGRTPIQYISVNYNVLSQTFKETSFVFTVDKAAVPAGMEPDEIRFSRYNNGTWRTQNATLVSESESAYRFRATTNGFSQFVITGPATDESSSCELFGLTYGSFIICWYWWVLAVPLVLLLGASRLRRE